MKKNILENKIYSHKITPLPLIYKRLKEQRNSRFIKRIQFIFDSALSCENKDHIQKIYLFGSCAYGKPRIKSDVDFCVIIDDNISWVKTAESITIKLWDGKYWPCDIIVINSSDFYKRIGICSIENVIFKYGKLLYERKEKIL